MLEPAAEQVPAFNPNATSALALALAAAGRPEEAVARAAEVLGGEGGTYADRVIALQATGLAHAQRGDASASADAFEQVRAVLEGNEDVVSRALSGLAEASALEVMGDERAPAVMAAADHELDRFGLGETAWRVAFSVAASGVDLARQMGV
jgi:ATP/maltotriose-dependent transcriptional regulator MalT